ncbi:MAG: Cell cycle protein FtsW/RodA/SpoVE [Erysipelotrichaceae bacterium]|nr:MAG: Cell cycle protein FtsW/RodA/SpoVE [Erysipelotrichaceae bacterium]
MMKTKQFSLKLPKGRDISIQLAMIGLMIIGLVMSGSAAMTSDVQLFDILLVIVKQIIFLSLGYVGYVWFSKHFELDFFRRHYFLIMFFSFVFAIIPLFFPEINGAKAWIPIPLPFIKFSIQPSEFLKMIAVIILAVYLGDVKVAKAKRGQLLKMPLFFIGGLLFIIAILQSDLGSAVVMLGMCALVFLLSTAPSIRGIQWSVLIGFAGFLILAGLLLTDFGLNLIRGLGIPEYMVNRFENTVDPFINRYGTGYQLVSSLMAFVKGNWFGVGFGKSLQKYGYLPAAQTDFILAIIAEEIGFLGVIAVTGLTLFIVVKIFIAAYKTNQDAHKMILSGVAYYLLLHFILNVGGVTALIPLTGVPLLLISSGGSSILSIMFALGIAQRLLSLQKAEIKP